MGHDSKLSRVIEISKALGLEFYLKQESSDDKNTQEMLEEILSLLRNKNKISEAIAPYDIQELDPETILEHDGAHSTKNHLPIIEVDAAAGAGAFNEQENIISYIAFRPDWLNKHGLKPNSCAIIRVRGDSMEPTFFNKSVVLVDRNRRRRHAGHVYVIRTEDGLVVKRLGKDSEGNWLLVSDNSEWKDAPLPPNAEIIGEVRWTAKTLK
ncbi:MAG: S24 family peptidase [Chromatiales bacterium]|nr:S24 family peptidase [Chromatiales bacterium]